jgi:hypothetical protein
MLATASRTSLLTRVQLAEASPVLIRSSSRSPWSPLSVVVSLSSNATCSDDGSPRPSRFRSVVLRNEVPTVALIHVVRHGFSGGNRFLRIQSSCEVVQRPGPISWTSSMSQRQSLLSRPKWTGHSKRLIA